MDIYNFDYKVKNQKSIFDNKSSLILGKFRVFHNGHKELFDSAKKLSTINKIGITLFNNDESNDILSLESKLNNLAEIGFDFVVLINFDLNIKSLQANDFIDHLVEKYKVENFIVGKDFRFGSNRMWGSKDLQNYFNKTIICENKKINKIKISSSSISEMITTGEIKLANELLTLNYNPVVNYHNGKLLWDDKIIKPHSGIYFMKMDIDGYWYHGLLHISMTDINKIVLLNYEDDLLDGSYTIQIVEEYRIIINSRFDLVVDDDKKKCLEFFYYLQRNNI